MGTTANERTIRSAGELLSRDDVRAAVAARLNAVMMSLGKDITPQMARLQRRVLASESAFAKLTSRAVRTFAASADVAASYEKDGTFSVEQINNMADLTVGEVLAEDAPDWATTAAMVETRAAFPTLIAYAPRACNVTLSVQDTPEHVKAFARELFGDSAKIAATIEKHAGHILTTETLAPYNGDLTGVLEADLLDGFRAFLTMWAPVPVTG